VKEQQRRAVAAGVAQEELAAARDVDDAPGQRLDGRLGDETRTAVTAKERREPARAERVSAASASGPLSA